MKKMFKIFLQHGCPLLGKIYQSEWQQWRARFLLLVLVLLTVKSENKCNVYFILIVCIYAFYVMLLFYVMLCYVMLSHVI